jgi:hypothetical protein
VNDGAIHTIVKDKAYIPDISELWKPGVNVFEFASRLVEDLKQVRALSPEEVNRAQSAIGKLHGLPHYTFTALTLNASVDAETVAEVFVRINGEGKKLNQADFIMTLMSVYWDEGRADLERFARDATQPGSGRPSPYNHIIKPSPDQLLRVGVGLGLKRARLENVYSVLRGRDATTGQVEVEKRDLQFALLKAAQQRALSLANWHHFLSALSLAGYRHEGMVWRDTGLSERMNHLLVVADRERVGREASPSAAVIDSQSVKTYASGKAFNYPHLSVVPAGCGLR